MKLATFLLLIISAAFTNFSYGQNRNQTVFHTDQNAIINYIDETASFWIPSYDNVKGGFFTNVDRQGNLISAWGTNKNMLTQSRNAYGMVRAFMVTGNEEYLTLAKNALDFMFNSSWDQTNGGWFGEVDINGIPQNTNNNKSAFDQHYALLGPLAYYEATNDSSVLDWFYMGYNKNETELWDYREGLEGYYDYVSSDWSQKSNKSFNATVDAVTTHSLLLYLLTGDEKIKNRLLKISDITIDKIASTADSYEIGFVEKFDSDWGWNDNTSDYNTRTIMGHVLKTTWILARTFQLKNDSTYLIAAEKLADNVMQKGYDHLYGGPYKDYDRVTGNMYFYGEDTAKAWWQTEQAIMAGLILYDITGKEKYITMADETINFWMNYFVDDTYGEVYSDVYRNGDLISAWGDHKGNGYKAAYHSIELGYYVYLYSSLYNINNEPVKLYYKYNEYYEPRNIKIWPIAIDDNRLIITSVKKNGVDFVNYNGEQRVLNLAANESGTFEITIANKSVINIASSDVTPKEYSIAQNYPNPFNPSTVINYYLPQESRVTLKVFNILGEEISTLVNKVQNSGNHKIIFDGQNLASGIYIYTINSGEFTSSKKMMLMK